MCGAMTFARADGTGVRLKGWSRAIREHETRTAEPQTGSRQANYLTATSQPPAERTPSS